MANILCEACKDDDEVNCPRDKDAKCLKCGKELCAYHLFKHLQDEHQISIDWKGF